jgi:hypothetical protein
LKVTAPKLHPAANARRALAFFALSHVLALAGMLGLLLPGVDPGRFSVAERAGYVASHAWVWRLGWLPWQLSALSNLWVCVALWRWSAQAGVARAQRAAGWALAWFVIAAIPEQWTELLLVTSFVDAAKNHSPAWARDWALYAGLTGCWANLGYTLMVGGWMSCARRLCPRAVAPRWLELSLLGGFVLSASLTWCSLSAEAAPGWFRAASAANGLAFPALIGWSLALWRRIGRAGEKPD